MKPADEALFDTVLLENDQGARVERLHLPHGLDSMASATEYAEHRKTSCQGGMGGYAGVYYKFNMYQPDTIGHLPN